MFVFIYNNTTNFFISIKIGTTIIVIVIAFVSQINRLTKNLLYVPPFIYNSPQTRNLAINIAEFSGNNIIPPPSLGVVGIVGSSGAVSEM